MLNTISDLMARVKGREILDSSVYFMISCFGMLTSVFIISLIFDSIDRIDRLKIYYKFIFVVTSLMLVFFAGISLLKFLSKCKSKIALNIRLSLYLIKKHKVPLFVVSLLITAIAYMIFLNMAKTEAMMVERNISEIAKFKVKHVNAWRNQQINLANNGNLTINKKLNTVSIQKLNIENKDAGFNESVKGNSDAGKHNAYEFPFSYSNNREFLQAIRNNHIWMGPVRFIENEDGSRNRVLNMVAPVMKNGPGGRVAEIRSYYIDPDIALGPIVTAWPKTDKTAKAFLFSRNGEEITILNNSGDHDVIYPMDLSKTSRVQWLKKMSESPSGIFHEADDRGKLVIGYVEKIPDSDWSLMIKIDEREAYGHIQKIAWYILLLAFLVIVMTGLGMVFYMRHRHMQYKTERLRLKLKQKALRQHYDYLSKYANDVIILMDGNGTMIEANDRSEKMFGKSRAEMIGQNIRCVFDLKDTSVFEEKWMELKHEKGLIFEAYGKHTNGSIFPVEISSRVIETDGRLFVQFIIRDISEKKKAEEMVWRHANYDQISGLPNRRMFTEKLFFETRKAQRSDASVALMFLDLDHFKDVNDTMGHGVGDCLLKEASDRLRVCVRETDTVARLGGDEFTVIVSDIDDFKDVERVAQCILDELSEPFTLEGQSVHISASIGITFFPQDAKDTHDLMKNADQAMYAAKSQGGNQYHYFTPSMQEAVQKRMHMINDLHVALENNQFETVFQPIIDLKTGDICRAEALIRWHHPVHGLINPASFVPLAEDTGLIQAFGDWVFLEAAKAAARWRKYVPDFQVSVNISPVQFKNEGIDTNVWFAHLKSLNLPPEAIVVEITEGLLLDIDEHTSNQLLALSDAGIEVALDDFGTGYSSLAYLKKLDIDYVKIDQMFVKNLTTSEEDRVLCEAMTVMAHKLDIAVIAEGVETLAQLRMLASFNCDYGQGYYISGPVNDEEFEELLAASRNPDGNATGTMMGHVAKTMTKNPIGERIPDYPLNG